MWIDHPKLAMIVLGTAKAIVDSYFHILEANNFNEKYMIGDSNPININFFSPKFTGWNKIGIAKDMGAIRSSSEMAAILNKYDIKYTKEYVTQLRKILKKLPAYRNYSEAIDGIIELVSIPHQKLRTIDCDLKHTWVADKEFII